MTQSTGEILLVAQCEADAELIRDHLQTSGIRNVVHRAFSGEEAIVFLNEAERATGLEGPQVPSVLIIDLALTGMSGCDLLEAISRGPMLEQMFRIVLGRLEDAESIKQACRLGAQSGLL